MTYAAPRPPPFRPLAAVAAVTAAAVLGAVGLTVPAQAEPDSEAMCPPIDPKWTLVAHGPKFLTSTTDPFEVHAPFGPHWSAVAVVGRYYNADLLHIDPAMDRRGHVTIETIPDCGPSGCSIPKPTTL